MAQAPVGRDRETDREVRTEAGRDKSLKKLPGTGWGDIERSRILERCGAELRRLDDYMASEHLALPGSSNMVAPLSYSGRDPDIRRAQLVREKQSRETEDRMERTQSWDVAASTWADKHRNKVRGRHGRRDIQREHVFIEEVHQAAREQKGQVVPDWVEETEQEQEQEPSPREDQHFRRGITGTM